jgi:drug/metabolite transporter (DMT)-like permease
MSGIKILGIALIAAGILGLAYRGFSFTKQTHEAKIGSLELSLNEKQTISLPAWAGVGALVAGAFLLMVPKPS